MRVVAVVLMALAVAEETCHKEEPAFHEFDEARMSRKELGDHGWAMLHTMAAYFPDLPSDSQLADAYQYLRLFAKMYPCRRCSLHFQQLLQDKPPAFRTRNDFVLYLCELHNVINEVVGKPAFPCDLQSLADRWGGGSDCGCA